MHILTYQSIVNMGHHLMDACIKKLRMVCGMNAVSDLEAQAILQLSMKASLSDNSTAEYITKSTDVPENDEVEHIVNNNILNTQNNGKNVILMVDDEEICLKTMHLLLIDTEYDLVVFQDGAYAIEFLKHNHVDLVLLDIMMSGMDGIEVLREIRQNPLTKTLPVILQSGIISNDDVALGYEMGVSSYIKKPYTKQKILQEIKSILGR